MILLDGRELEIRGIDEATALAQLRKAREFIKVPRWNADFLVLCNDGSVLAFWAECDDGPRYWQLGQPKP